MATRLCVVSNGVDLVLLLGSEGYTVNPAVTNGTCFRWRKGTDFDGISYFSEKGTILTALDRDLVGCVVLSEDLDEVQRDQIVAEVQEATLALVSAEDEPLFLTLNETLSSSDYDGLLEVLHSAGAFPISMEDL